MIHFCQDKSQMWRVPEKKNRKVELIIANFLSVGNLEKSFRGGN